MVVARTLAFLCVAFAVALARPAWGFHTIFHFQVDRFEADGNTFGPFDGVPDFVDEFDDDTYGDDWSRVFGTVVQSDGVLNIQNPGEHYDVGFPVDVSEVWTTTVMPVLGGDVTLTSYWVPPTMGPGTSLHTTLALFGSSGHQEYVGMHVQQGLTGGPVIGLHFLERQGQEWTPLQVETVPYDPATTSNRLVLRLTMSGGMVTGSFSVDGGATFASPFTPGPIVSGMATARLMLGADPMIPAPPQCGNAVVDPGEECDLGRKNGKGCCTKECALVDTDGDGTCDPLDDCPDVADPGQVDTDGDGLGDACDPCTTTTDGQRRWGRALVAVSHVNDDRPGNESMRVGGTFSFASGDAPLDPITTGASITLRSGKDGSAVTVALPPGPYVEPGPGWLADGTGSKFVFLDRRRGGTQGVHRMAVRRTPTGRVRVDVAAARGSFNFGAWSFPPIDAAVAFGETTGACAEILFAERACAYPQSRRIVCR